jgi:enoyl-[acyl-carrier protein] reductase/trans-2-enoyl-CoA reductase (NAD+)
MKITPKIRGNVFINAHPLGCKENVKSMIDEVQALPPYQGPKNVLIIGGSSGYGLSTRISLAFVANANTINVSFESTPRGKRTGSAGYWNNIFFQHYANGHHKDFNVDAFSEETKEQVATYIKEEFGTVDLVVYSLAAGVRPSKDTGELVRSSIKTIGEPVKGKTIDISSKQVQDLEVTGANQEEIDNTVFVMGGTDWFDWIQYLDQKQVLSPEVKTISYTYIGGPSTEKIYRHGTLGKAKENLEENALKLNQILSDKYNGEALISSSKAVVSKASVFIPQMPIYVSCLYETMQQNGVHETITQHKHRLFKDMVYGNKRITDSLGRIRLDHLEMEEHIQTQCTSLMEQLSSQELLDLDGTKEFLEEFYTINGFHNPNVDYDQEVDLDTLSETYPIK